MQQEISPRVFEKEDFIRPKIIKEKQKKRKNLRLKEFSKITNDDPSNNKLSEFQTSYEITNNCFSLNYQESDETLDFLDIPQAPHNTSQYLSQNFNNFTQIFQPGAENFEINDDIFFTGGSMCGIPNSRLLFACQHNCFLNFQKQAEIINEQRSMIRTLEQQLEDLRTQPKNP